MTTGPQDDLTRVAAVAEAAEAAGYDGPLMPGDRDLRRIPRAFRGYRTEW